MLPRTSRMAASFPYVRLQHGTCKRHEDDGEEIMPIVCTLEGLHTHEHSRALSAGFGLRFEPLVATVGYGWSRSLRFKCVLLNHVHLSAKSSRCVRGCSCGLFPSNEASSPAL